MIDGKVTRQELVARNGLSPRYLDKLIESGQHPGPDGRIGYCDYWLESSLKAYGREKALQRARAHSKAPEPTGKRCETCDKPMGETAQQKQYCSRSCQQKAYRQRVKEKAA